MARRALLAAVTAAAFFAVGLVLAEDQTPPVDVVGSVIAVTPDEMTVKTDQNQEWKFKLNDQTQRLAGMSVGDRVRVKYKDEWGTDVALNVARADSMNTPGTASGSPAGTSTTGSYDTNRTGSPGSAGTTGTYDSNRNLTGSPTAGRTATGSGTYDTRSNSATNTGMTTGTNQGNTYRYVDGTIVSFTPTQIVVRGDNGQTETYYVTPGMDRTHFIEGKRVRLNFEMDENQSGKLMARQVGPVTGTGSTSPSSYTTVARNDNPNANVAANDTMPDTGSSLPTIALLGLMSILTGSALWLARNRFVF
jgi:LPXTG-motif cell wall-anchored protein